jgi:hypothetical protein
VSNQPSPIERVLDQLGDFSERGGEFRAKCPAHEGNSDDSLSIREGEEGRVLLKCFAECEFKEIVAALGLEEADLFAQNGHPGPRTKTKKSKKRTIPEDKMPKGPFFEFRRPDGTLLYKQLHKGPFYQPVGEGLWRADIDGLPRILYRLPEFLEAAQSGKPVIHCEGCKDVETARERLGVVATTSGSTSTWRPELRAHYTGVDVVVISDNDAPGHKYAEQVARDVSALAKSVKVVHLPGLTEAEDLTDWLDDGHTPEEFFEVVEAAPFYDPSEAAEEPWPEPVELDTGLPPVADLKESMLPDPLSEWVFDVAERMERVPPDFVAADAVVAISSLIGRKVGIRPKRHDEWTVIPNLWGAPVGRPSTMKTPAQNAALKPIMRLSEKATAKWEEAIEEWKNVTSKVLAAQEKAFKSELEAVMNLGENRIGMRIPRSAWFLRDLRFPHS